MIAGLDDVGMSQARPVVRVLWGDSLQAAVAEFLREPASRFVFGLCGVLLLAADIVLPVPSSLVASALGAALGWLWGTAAAALGLTWGCVVGFGIGRLARDRLGTERLGPDYQHVSSLLQRYGTSVLVLCRGVPVLAEASVMAAGALGMSARRCIAVAALANLGVAGVYATVGAAAWDVSPAAAFATALLLPGVLLIVASAAERKSSPDR
jgi:uncharacterized membrane protein YdjX (TVP38/TMEM64 family)